MTVDIRAAERFILANGRLLDRHRLAVLLHDAPTAPVLDGLRAYRNLDGGFGHALEPDVREPWLQRATDWCWAKLDEADRLDAYWVKFRACVPRLGSRPPACNGNHRAPPPEA